MPPPGQLRLGAELAFVIGADRRCVGIWRRGQRLGCPTATELAATARGGLCLACQAMDRSDSIAADTRLSDSREFNMYLAHHGSAIKVGTTAADRGQSRLLEQGAFVSVVLSTGTLVAARRAENLLASALGLPDRVSTVSKRAARARPVDPERLADAVLKVAEQATGLPWPPGQTVNDTITAHRVIDHTSTYGLPRTGLHPAAELTAPAPGDVVAGRIKCRIGIDIYIDTPLHGTVLLDTRLLAGWSLGRAHPDAPFTAPVIPVEPPQLKDQQDALF